MERTDAAERLHRPGAGAWPGNELGDGIPAGYGSRPNAETGQMEVVKRNAAGLPDTVIREFPDRLSAQLWLRLEWLAGKLR